MRHALLVLLLLAPAPASAQLLGRASDAARGSSSSNDNDYDDDDDDGGSFLSSASSAARGDDYDDYDQDYDDDDYDYDGGGSTLGRASGAARSGGWGSGSGSGEVFLVRGCPYEDDRAGLGFSAPVGEAPPGVAARLEVEGGYALEGAGRGAFAARVQLSGFALDLTTRYSIFVEPVESGVLALALGRVGLEYRLLDLPAAQIRLGGGLRHMQDELGAIFGGDATIGVDLFLGDPVIVSLEAGAGIVGEAAVALVRGRIGVIFDSTEIYAGYHYEGLFAGQHVDLGGPMAGVRYWL